MSVPTPKIQVFSMITCQYSFFPMPYHYFIFIPKRSIGSYSHLHYMEIKSSLANSSRASGVAKQLISSPRAAHPRGAFDLFPVKSKSLLLKSSRLPNFLINYAFFCGNTLRSTSHRDPVMQTEEYVPQRIPAISGSANSFTEETPNTYSAATMIKVVREVNTLRDKVWVILVFTTSSSVSFLSMFCMFSRTRSKITIVALME